MNNYYMNQPSYNEPRLWQTSLAGPEVFVITEFDCIFLVYARISSIKLSKALLTHPTFSLMISHDIAHFLDVFVMNK